MTVEIFDPSTREEWLALRRPAVTASVAGCLLGVHPWDTPFSLWATKSGRRVEDNSDNDVLRRGRLLEPVIFAMLREDRPDWTVEYPLGNRFFYDREARIGATPDSFAKRPDIFGRGTVQGKTIARSDFEAKWINPDTGEIELPLWIAIQAIVEATLTGCTWAAVAVLIIDQRRIDLDVIDVPLNTRVMDRLRREVREFWRMVEDGEEPPIDWNRDGAAVSEVYLNSMPNRKDLTAVDGLDSMVSNFVSSKKIAGEHVKLIDLMRPRILHALGTAEAAFTQNWNIVARTSVRTGPDGQPVKSRALKITPKENPHARF